MSGTTAAASRRASPWRRCRAAWANDLGPPAGHDESSRRPARPVRYTKHLTARNSPAGDRAPFCIGIGAAGRLPPATRGTGWRRSGWEIRPALEVATGVDQPQPHIEPARAQRGRPIPPPPLPWLRRRTPSLRPVHVVPRTSQYPHPVCAAATISIPGFIIDAALGARPLGAWNPALVARASDQRLAL